MSNPQPWEQILEKLGDAMDPENARAMVEDARAADQAEIARLRQAVEQARTLIAGWRITADVIADAEPELAQLARSMADAMDAALIPSAAPAQETNK